LTFDENPLQDTRRALRDRRRVFPTRAPPRHSLNFEKLSIDSVLGSKKTTTMEAEKFTSHHRNFPKKKCGECFRLCTRSGRLTHVAGVLGATGSVGQRFILLLALHPHFELHAVGASERSAGKKYKDAVKWKQALPFSDRIGELVVKKCTPDEFKDCDLVFSGLDSDVAGDVGRRSSQPRMLAILT